MWVHLFPSRTQKLSTCTPTIVAGRLAVKIGNANTKNQASAWFFFYIPAFSGCLQRPSRILAATWPSSFQDMKISNAYNGSTDMWSLFLFLRFFVAVFILFRLIEGKIFRYIPPDCYYYNVSREKVVLFLLLCYYFYSSRWSLCDVPVPCWISVFKVAIIVYFCYNDKKCGGILYG